MKTLTFKFDARANITRVYSLDPDARGSETYLGNAPGKVTNEEELKKVGFVPSENIIFQNKNLKIVRLSAAPVIC